MTMFYLKNFLFISNILLYKSWNIQSYFSISWLRMKDRVTELGQQRPNAYLSGYCERIQVLAQSQDSMIVITLCFWRDLFFIIMCFSFAPFYTQIIRYFKRLHLVLLVKVLLSNVRNLLGHLVWLAKFETGSHSDCGSRE